MVNTQPTKPSSKALGKRPMRNGVIAPSPLSLFTPSANSPAADEETDDPSTSTAAVAGAGAGPSGVGTSNSNVSTRLNNHKRVLPSRVRRGGVYSLVGTSDTDQNILDMLKRRGENDPLIPTHTVFILTTDSSQVPSTSTSEIGLNKFANERYFERPEVIRAYKNQQDIQVPEFTQIDEDTVGGRLRTRTDEEPPELTDAAYEKRHRKYEMIEKRQRLREKEKLQHEHYKLKERIEQLRTMDYNAFLTLPDELFSNEENENAIGLDYADGAPEPNNSGSGGGGSGTGTGSAASLLQEAERRRRLMLDVAASLEERYRTLLPTERRPAEPRFVTRVSSVEPSIPDENVEAILTTTEAERDTAAAAAAAASTMVTSRSKPSKLKLRAQNATQPTPPPTAASEPLRKRRETPIRNEFSPGLVEMESLEDSSVVAPSRPISRQKRSKVEERPVSQQLTPPTSNRQEQQQVDIVPDSLSPPDRTPDTTMDDITQESQKSRLGGAVTPTVHHEGVLPTSIIKEFPPPVTSNSKRRRRAMGQVQVNRNFNVIQYKVPQEQEPSRKKSKSLHALPLDHEIPPSTQTTGQVTDTNTRERLTTGADYSIQASKDTRHTEHSTTKSHFPPPDSAEPEIFVEAFGRFLSLSTKDMSAYLADRPRSIPYAQLRQLEKPDQGGEFDINVDVDVINTSQPDVDETPTADEPVTPPPESVGGGPTSRSPELLLLANSNLKQRRSGYWMSSVDVDVDDGVSKAGHRKRRSRTPLATDTPRFGSTYTQSAEPPSSPPLTITSLQSYELNSPDGGGGGSGNSRKRLTGKPINALLASSRHNEEPGRKTGRSVKAFGAEVPSFEVEEEFELPRWMVREVLNERRRGGVGGGGGIGEEDGDYEEDFDLDADGEVETVSDGDPPSFAVGIEHGEALHDPFVDSVSAMGRPRANRR